MPYRNIVFIKLEKRLLNDHRWFMMSEGAQLLYIKLLLIGATTYNNLPKDCHAIAKLCRSEVRKSRIEKYLLEIKEAFPKFKEDSQRYYFEGFEEKTNYIPEEKGNPREIPGKSQVSPKVVTDKEEEEDKDKEEDKTILPDSLEYKLASLLCSLILTRKPDMASALKVQKADYQAWAQEIDRMHRIDNRQYQTIEQVIRWSQEDSFWKNNILSAGKLRDKFDALELKMNDDLKEWADDLVIITKGV